MTKYGMPGVWTHAFVDMWSPGYFAFMASNHNGMLRMYETFGNGGATTMKRKVDRGEGGDGRRPDDARVVPPAASLQGSGVVDAQQHELHARPACCPALQLTAAFPQVILENFYQKSRNAIEAGKKDAPYGFVIPAGQRDMTRVAFAGATSSARRGSRSGTATAEVKLADGTFPAGSFVIKRDQPYGRLAKILLEKQDFPDANLRTYDDTRLDDGTDAPGRR